MFSPITDICYDPIISSIVWSLPTNTTTTIHFILIPALIVHLGHHVLNRNVIFIKIPLVGVVSSVQFCFFFIFLFYRDLVIVYHGVISLPFSSPPPHLVLHCLGAATNCFALQFSNSPKQQIPELKQLFAGRTSYCKASN